MTSTSPPSPRPESDSDRRTHTTHTINLPYRDARNGASRPQNPQQRQPCPQHDGGSHSQNHQHQHHSREPPKITPIPRISSTTHNSLAETTTPPPSSPTSHPSPTNAPPAASSPSAAAPAAPPADERPSTPTSSSTGSDHEAAAASLAEGLEGKYVDEFGNILDWDGTVLGRVEGDLPSMIGRPVADSGDILDTSGDVVGHVSENYPLQQRQQEEARAKIPPLHELDGGMRVDAAGNIYNSKGDVVGRLNEPPPQSQQDQPQPRPGEDSRNPCSCREPDRAAAAAPNPSEIYLDVKSTYDGIQLIIKIPTVFNRDLIDQDR